MSVTPLHLHYFQADKIYIFNGRYTGQLQQSAPYQITTYNGPELGLIGVLPALLYRLYELNTAQAANDELLEANPPSLLQKLKQRCIGH